MSDSLTAVLSALAGSVITAALSLCGPIGRAWLAALLAGKPRSARIAAMLDVLRGKLAEESEPHTP